MNQQGKPYALLLKIGLICLISLFLLQAQKADCRAEKGKKGPGQFFLVSVGVGDPDLITVRAIETIKASDVIICRPETRECFSRYLEDKTFWKGAFHEWRTHGLECADIKDPEKRETCKKDLAVRKAL